MGNKENNNNNNQTDKIKRLIEDINKKTDYVFESDMPEHSNRFESVPFSKNNYHAISPTKKNIAPPNASNKMIAFIDGGNSEIIKRANLSLQMIRVAAVFYQDNKRTRKDVFEYFCVVRINDGIFNAQFFYDEKSASIVPNKQDLMLSHDDETIREGITHANISKIGSISRLFSEYILASLVAKDSDFVVMDGTLQKQVTNHGKYIEALFESAKSQKKQCIVCGLSKSSGLVTKKGQSLEWAISKNCPPGLWYYHPLYSNTGKAQIGMIKLNEKSERCFRFEVNGNFDDELMSLLTSLNENSNDPIIKGYPYGLVEADKFARISNQEAEYQKTVILSKAKIKDEPSTHDILDTISF